jgi:phosphotriesterase-related protein
MTRLTRDQMRGKAQTVLGLIDPAELGSTLMHEHLLWNITPPARRGEAMGPPLDPGQWWDLLNADVSNPHNTTQLDHDRAIRATAEMVAHGGRTVVELTIGGLMPDPDGLAKVARETGANIVMGCGHYVHDYQDPANADRTVDSFAREMIDQVQLGAWNTCAPASSVRSAASGLGLTWKSAPWLVPSSRSRRPVERLPSTPPGTRTIPGCWWSFSASTVQT